MHASLVTSAASAAGVVVKGKWLRIAALRDEDWLQDELTASAETIIGDLKKSGQKADIYTFAQKLPDFEPRFRFAQAWDNLAVVPIKDYADWWENRIPQETRKNVRRAGKRGLIVRVEQYSDDIVRGIKEIYDETPMRQGRRFWHYGKDFETVKRENSTYFARSEFLCAWCERELVGFLRMVYTGVGSFILQITSKNAHRDKRPMNALIAKAVEICAEKKVSYLIYGQYCYNNKSQSPLLEFKRRNGFEELLLPRYYIPLTLKGRVAMWLGVHRGFRRFLPNFLDANIMKARTFLFSKMVRDENSGAVAAELPGQSSE